MTDLHIVNPYRDDTQHFNFAAVRYFHYPAYLHLPNDARDGYRWLIWTDGVSHVPYDVLREASATVELISGTETEEKTKIKGMIELQESPEDPNVVWLKYFEVTQPYQGRGFSKEMCAVFAAEFATHYPSKRLLRSSASELGQQRLKANLTKALEQENIQFFFND